MFNSKSVLSLTIAMHEMGHAIQHNKKSKLFKFYYFLTVFNKITSLFLFPTIVFLVVALFMPMFYLNIVIYILLGFYITNLLTRLIVIPLEKDASKIAYNLLKEYKIFDKGELKMAKKLLNLAYFTYIGGFFNYYRKTIKKILKGF